MRRIFSLIFVVLTSFLLLAPLAAAVDIPKVIAEGFGQYAKEGPKAALEAWSKGSAIEGSKEMLSQASNFTKIQDFYGGYSGYNVVKAVQHTSSSAVYMIEIKYEKGNVFAKFFTYTMANGNVVITTYNFHTNPENVWPAYLVVGSADK